MQMRPMLFLAILFGTGASSIGVHAANMVDATGVISPNHPVPTQTIRTTVVSVANTPSFNATITNTTANPVPVLPTGTQTITGSVTIGGTPLSTQVLNQDPRRGVTLTGFAQTGNFTVASVNLASRFTGQGYIVPAGQRLVVESVSATCSLPQGQAMSVSLREVLPNNSVIEYNFSAPIELSVNGIDEHLVATLWRAYIDAGSLLQLYALRESTTGQFDCSAVVNGFTVDMP